MPGSELILQINGCGLMMVWFKALPLLSIECINHGLGCWPERETSFQGILSQLLQRWVLCDPQVGLMLSVKQAIPQLISRRHSYVMTRKLVSWELAPETCSLQSLFGGVLI